MRIAFTASPADRRLLPEGRLAGPMPWVIAIMMFLTVLAAAGGIALGQAGRSFTAGLANRISVQVIEPNPDLREAQARAIVAALTRTSGVSRVRRMPAEQIDQLLAPWLGAGLASLDLPVPALIDADMTSRAHATLPVLAAHLHAIAPTARIDDHAAWLAPLGRLVRTLVWLAVALVVLMAIATAAVVALAARGALDTHRATIDVLHLMGGTDTQIARLFQRRLALDALFGGLTGWAAATLMLVLIGWRLERVGSGLIGAVVLPVAAWSGLLLLPIGGALIAASAARFTVTRALRRLP